LDWKRAIEINTEALTRIVAGLVALLGLRGGAIVTRLPRLVYQEVIQTLHKTESALRRLVFIVAQGLVVALPQRRTMPPGLVIAGSGAGPMVFQLFDTRKHVFRQEETPQLISGPRIRVVGDADPRSQFLASFPKPDIHVCSEAEALRLSRRVDAVRRALDHLPRQAKRMAQWLRCRAMMEALKFTTPMRPGPPPGHRKIPVDDIDRVLTECHGLAWDALRPNTS
jgi:hypothetical protein